MTSPVRPARTDAASMTAIRGLLERNLLERAVALSESRWPGSGPVVELAHEWTVLSPGARRERLASIGPEELARLRGLSELQPDLARVLDDLEARGIIPPEDSVNDVAEIEAATQPVTFEEAVADAALDYSEQGLQRLASSVQEGLPPHLEAAFASDETAEATVAAAAAAIARERAAHGAIEQVPMPELDLGLPSTGEFLAEEVDRRHEANELANSILDRARSRVDDAASRLLPESTAVRPISAADLPSPDASSTPVEPASQSSTVKTATSKQSTRVDPVLDHELLIRIEQERVLQVLPGATVLSDGDLRAVATATNRNYVELRPSVLGSRSFFGGLVRDGGRIEPEVGAFPAAVHKRSLVAIRGRLYPKTIERLRAGYCDIPGTNATVRVHPDCRIVLLPE
ncbi:MAG: hypothetical protein M3439_08665 [Chloroflexota bacterium]|nr:hypothetical protein [Chloroflexota bacterium]